MTTAEAQLEAVISVKWPALVVVGQPVTPDQAAEILVRTASWPLSTNAHSHDRLFNGLAGYEGYSYDRPVEDDIPWQVRIQKNNAASKALRILPLHYLLNYRLTSSWIGGPYGWCAWSGHIGCCTHNIGKWPSVEEVTQEWEVIAAAFPFLELRAQVFSGENGEEGTRPTAEWVVSGGKVVCGPPGPAIGTPHFDMANLKSTFSLEPALREVGATRVHVARGIELAKAADPLPEGEEE